MHDHEHRSFARATSLNRWLYYLRAACASGPADALLRNVEYACLVARRSGSRPVIMRMADLRIAVRLECSPSHYEIEILLEPLLLARLPGLEAALLLMISTLFALMMNTVHGD